MTSAIRSEINKATGQNPATDSSSLVSVVIPTHNRSDLLARAIRSVQGQTHQDFEIIVVDDASRDNTHEVVKSFADPRIRYIRHETNMGGSAARNTGIRAATGEFIAFLDDDDAWKPEKMKLQLQVLRKFDVVMCTSDEDPQGLGRHNNRTSVELDDLRRGRFTAGGTGVLMGRSRVLKEIMFDETLPRCQDWDLFIRIAQRHTIGYINKPLLLYNEGDHGRISNVILNMPLEQLEKRLIMLEKHREFFGPQWYRKHLAGFLLYGIKHRPDKLQHLIYSVRRCGVRAVVYALTIRVYQKLTGSV